MAAIGIDLGTCNCCMAYVKDDKPIVIPDQNGKFITPSYISFVRNEILFGENAIYRILQNEKNTVYDVKRFLGRNFTDPLVQKLIDKWKFNLINYKGKINVAVTYKGQDSIYSPESLSGLLLKHLKKQAETYIGQPVTKAVITVPTYFNDAQRQATIDAGKIGGFEEVRLLNEPSAAAIVYSTENNTNVEKTILVFDFGGGTFDVSIVKFKNRKIEVIAIDGDVELGGNDITENIFNKYANIIREKYNIDVFENPRLYVRLKKMCDDVKKQLSTSVEAYLQLLDIGVDTDFEITVTRDEFNKINSKIFNKTIEVVNRCLRKINTDVEAIDEFVVVGGSSRIKKIIQMLEDLYKKPLKRNINPDFSVAEGAAIVASKWSGDSPYEDVIITDICPYSLGVELAGNKMSVIIPKYTKLPAKATKIYTNTKDNQAVIKVKIFAGEDKSTINNTFIAELKVSGFKPSPAHSIKLYETFIYDENGIFSVEVEGPNIEKHNLVISLDEGGLSLDELREQVIDIDEQYKYLEEFQMFKQIRAKLLELCNNNLMRNEMYEACEDTLAYLKIIEYSKQNFEKLKTKYELWSNYYETLT